MDLILTYDPNSIDIWNKIKRHVKPVETLIDIGPGIRPQMFVPCARHICFEPHGEYCEILRNHGYEVIQGAAPEDMVKLDPADTIVAIDVIEHMTRADGLEMVSEMLRLARKQVVIFTPLGFMRQDGGSDRDPWGYHGQYWQEHRSGWTPADFPGWRCEVDLHFHERNKVKYGAFFAVYG
jgi:hypothetical protein